MIECDYCSGSYSRAKLKAHERKCFEEKYAQSHSKRVKLFSEQPLESHTIATAHSTAVTRSSHNNTQSASATDPDYESNISSNEQVNDSYNDCIGDDYYGDDYYCDDDPVQYIRGIPDDLQQENGDNNPTANHNHGQPTNTEPIPERESDVAQTLQSSENLNSIDRPHFDKVLSTRRILNPSESFSLELLRIIDEFNISVAGYHALVAFANDVITMSTANDQTASQDVHFYQILSPYLTANLLKALYPVKAREYDICSSGCHLYMSKDTRVCPNAKCTKPRFRKGTENTTKIANATMTYLPLSEQLATFVAHAKTRQLMNHRTSVSYSNEIKSDIFDGNILKDKQWNCENIVLGVYIDGFQPFIHSNVSMTIVHVVIMNFPPEERYKHDNMLQIAIIPTGSKNGNLDSFIAPLIEELIQLESVGMSVKCDDGKSRTFKAQLIIATGDIPGTASLAHHGGHMSSYGCRICLIPSVRLESPQSYERRKSAGEHSKILIGYGRYFPGSAVMDPLRTIGDYRNGDMLHNINSPSLFAKLASFHGPFFFGLDEMHLFGCNLGPQIWAMIANPMFRSPFLLSKSQQSLVSAAMRKSSSMWPGTFDGKITDVLTNTKNTRAVDYIDLLLYIIPTIVIEQLETANVSKTAIAALASLIKGVSISLSWSISEEEIKDIEDCLQKWHIFAIADLPPNVCTANMHYLRHVSEAIRQLGPMRTYGVRCMERAVGLFGKRIKSAKESGTNAGNTLELLSARRYMDRSDTTQKIFASNGDDSESNDGNVAEQDPDIWGPHLSDKMTTDSFGEHYNLLLYLRKFWARIRNVLESSLPPLSKSIKVGKRLFLKKCTYDCTLPLGSDNHGTFVKLSLPVDHNAHGGLLSEDASVKKTYFGEAILFFEHQYLADTRVLCLIRLAHETKLTDYGYPYGKLTFGTKGRYYVCDAREIDCAVGVLASPTKKGRYYYVYNDMMKIPITLGGFKSV